MSNYTRTDEWLNRRENGLETDGISKEKTGRDPRAMSRTDLEALGHKPMAVLDVIREKCLDCCCGVSLEVRKCVAVECPSWPFRMGWNPWRERREISAERRAEMGARLAAARRRSG
jgi:hypothetical protein